MHGAANLALIATSISMGTAVLAGLMSLSVAVRSRHGTDPTVSILFYIGVALTGLTLTAAALIAACGMAYIGMLKAALLPTAAFAVTALLLGLIRGLRSAKAIKP